MNIALWAVQIILGIKLVSAAITHGPGQSKPDMQAAMQKLGPSSRLLHAIIAAVAFLGGLGLFLPGLWDLPPWVTPGTAAVVSLLLLCSIFFHVKYRDAPKVFASLVLFALAAFVACGRWMLVRFY